MTKDQIQQYIEQHKDRFLAELIDLLRIPSISAHEEHKGDVHRAAEYTRDRLLEAGVDKAELYETEGHPIVYGEKMIDPALPTILVYGHYDVQPADPLELWKSPPFEPELRDGKIYGRGTADDKGQFYIHVKAFELMERMGNLACNVKFMIEGEEEVGSANLEVFVQEHADMLACDVILISDTTMISLDHPSISTGLKGLSYLEVKVTGPNRDLHSGTYGGAVANPIIVLSKMIASLTDSDNRVTIPGFYDKVAELTREERDRLADAPFDEEDFKKELDVEELAGEKGYTIQEQLGIRPTLDVNGIWGGYTGKGAKTVLPSEAFAKISMRLVPDQNHREITDLFINHIKSIAPRSVKVEVTPHHGGQPAVTPIDSLAFKAAENAFEEGWGKKPVPTRDGGSIPIVALFEKALRSHTVLMGFGLDSDAIHSPNESFGLANFYKGIETAVLYHKHFAALHQSK
jgi:acetylornithine deacetylase/succinyl-diaminopimelate desuccinylase-like protein